ncbi:MAG: restriction endonuclease [Limisphaerales bacterium]
MKKPGKSRKKQTSVSPPVLTCPDTLPLLDSQVSWNRFEGFIRQLICLMPGVVSVKRYGKSGSRQRGIDLIAALENGERWVFQCKQYSSFKLADAKKAVCKMAYSANKYFLIVACQTDSTVHDYIEVQPNWELWDGERVSDEVLKLPRDAARELVARHFGSAWCKAFLGVGSTSSFTPWKIFFARWLNHDRLFNHSWQLVGRTDFVSALDQFCRDDRKRVALLIGRGGIGKSKLLHAFAAQHSTKRAKTLLWFVEENIPLLQQSVDELPDNPCVIVVDDAHRSENLKPLLAAAIHSHSPRKLLLSTRPQRLDFLKAELTRAGFDYTEILELPQLKHLDRDEVKALARQALGNRLAHLDRRLAAVTWDCPLVTVVGGKLLASASLDPQLLESHDGFRAEVLNRFQDIIVGRIADGQDAKFYSELLQVLSATAPFPVEHDGFLKATAEILKRTPEEVVKGIAELEQTGVLLRRGRLLRNHARRSGRPPPSSCLRSRKRPANRLR